MKKLVKTTLVAAAAAVALAFVGCANETVEYVEVVRGDNSPVTGSAGASILSETIQKDLDSQKEDVANLAASDRAPIDLAVDAESIVIAANTALSQISSYMINEPELIKLAPEFAKVAVHAASSSKNAIENIPENDLTGDANAGSKKTAAVSKAGIALKNAEDKIAALENAPENHTIVPDAIAAAKSAQDVVDALNPVLEYIRKDFSPELTLKIDGVISRETINTAYLKYYKGPHLYDGAKHTQVKKITITGKPTSIAFAADSAQNSTSVGAFQGFTALEEVILPEGITKIGKEAFGDCQVLKTIALPSTVTSIDEQAFRGCHKQLSSVDLSKTSVKTIGARAFKDCQVVETIVLPSTVTSIGDEAFLNCMKLASIDLSKTGVTAIKKSVFQNCSTLKTVLLPSAITTIGVSAFFGCTSLAEIALPASLTTIGNEAFLMCYKLEKLDLSKSTSLTTIGEAAFRFTVIKELNFPASLTKIGKEAFVTAPASIQYTSESGAVTTINANPTGKKLESVTFEPDSGKKWYAGTIEVPLGNDGSENAKLLSHYYKQSAWTKK